MKFEVSASFSDLVKSISEIKLYGAECGARVHGGEDDKDRSALAARDGDNDNDNNFESDEVEKVEVNACDEKHSDDGDKPEGFQRIGNIFYKMDLILGRGCNGTVVYRGMFDGRDIAVKQLLQHEYSLVEREVTILRLADQHPNVIRYFCKEEDTKCIYIALELCEGTLKDYVKNKFQNKINIEPIELLRQALMGLAHLHSLDIVHRDLKPQNILISRPSANGEVRALISDFGYSRKLPEKKMSFSSKSGFIGTEGWSAPEMSKKDQNKTFAVDIFSAGCCMYYLLTKGQHPFGNDASKRQSNIQEGQINLDALPKTSDGYIQKDIIETMLSRDPKDRPTVKAVLHHPLFWNKEKQLLFIQDASDWTTMNIVPDLEQDCARIVCYDWTKYVSEELKKDKNGHPKRYTGSSVQALLRFIRNKKHHYNELPEDVMTSLGSVPDQFLDYFTSRFPLLFIHTYRAMKYYADEDTFKAYYILE